MTENGWPRCGPDELDRSPVPGTNIVIPLRRGEVSTVMKAFAADFHAFAESLNNARGGTDEGGWTPTNSVATSNHLGGTAMDLNWEDHTFRVSYAGFDEREIAMVREILEFYTFDGLKMIFWAQDWNNPKDCMHFQMGYDTWYSDANRPDDRIQKFIDAKIHPDGFSSFRRGDEKPPIPRKLVIPDAGGIYWSDVSHYQQRGGVPIPVDDSYPFEIFSFRTNSGDLPDNIGLENARRTKALLDSGKLKIAMPYYFFRPGEANCDLHREILTEAGLFNHPRTISMVDVESDGGKIRGDNSWEINDEISRIRMWYENHWRVIGYLNPNPDLSLWPTRRGLNIIIPQYDKTPGDISSIKDEQAKRDAIGHQFTSSATEVAPWTGLKTDQNWSPYTVAEFEQMIGVRETPIAPTEVKPPAPDVEIELPKELVEASTAIGAQFLA